MAATTQGAAKPKAPAAPEEREPTQRIVLRREKVLVLADDITAEQIEALLNAGKQAKVKLTGVEEAWQPVGIEEGASKEKAIEAHTGEPGTPDAKCGTFKAPTVKAWSGGLRLVAPPKPLVEKEAIE